ncbi:MAG: carbon-nitrogen hydrolase [Pirellulaceae bacterium]
MSKSESNSHVENASPMPETVRIALLQMACTDAKEENVATALARIHAAAAQGAQIVCLQELFATHYPCQDEDHARFALAEPIPGPTHDQLQSAAAREQVVVISSLFERRAPGLYHNTTVVFDADGRSLGKYRKMHIPDDPHYYEKFYFTPGDLGFRCFATRYGQVGVGICWDQWYPEAARLMALQGAEMLFYPTAIGWLSSEKSHYGESQRSAWETAMRAHAIANGVYVAAANRVGTEGQIEFWGSSFAADPYGNVLHRASTGQDELVLVEYHRNLVDTARTHWPFLRDRRIDAYGDLTQRFID